MQSLTVQLGVVLNQIAPGKHVPVAERKIKTIKKTVRSLIASLPYRLPIAWFPMPFITQCL